MMMNWKKASLRMSSISFNSIILFYKTYNSEFVDLVIILIHKQLSLF